MKRAVIGCIVALGLVVGGGAGAAFAGETNGKGDPIPERTRPARPARSQARTCPTRRRTSRRSSTTTSSRAGTCRATASTSATDSRASSRRRATPAAATSSSAGSHREPATRSRPRRHAPGPSPRPVALQRDPRERRAGPRARARRAHRAAGRGPVARRPSGVARRSALRPRAARARRRPQRGRPLPVLAHGRDRRRPRHAAASVPRRDRELAARPQHRLDRAHRERVRRRDRAHHRPPPVEQARRDGHRPLPAPGLSPGCLRLRRVGARGGPADHRGRQRRGITSRSTTSSSPSGACCSSARRDRA